MPRWPDPGAGTIGPAPDGRLAATERGQRQRQSANAPIQAPLAPARFAPGQFWERGFWARARPHAVIRARLHRVDSCAREPGPDDSAEVHNRAKGELPP